jgi:hypothetical protein
VNIEKIEKVGPRRSFLRDQAPLWRGWSFDECCLSQCLNEPFDCPRYSKLHSARSVLHPTSLIMAQSQPSTAPDIGSMGLEVRSASHMSSRQVLAPIRVAPFSTS